MNETQSGFGAWTVKRNARAVEKGPYTSRRLGVIGSVVCGCFAALGIYGTLASLGDREVFGDLAVFSLVMVAATALNIWSAMRFRLAAKAELQGDTLTVSAARWNVTLRPSDVKRVLQIQRPPNDWSYLRWVSNPAWGAWLRVDASSDGGRVRRYLVWRQDSPALLDQLQRAGFPVVGEVRPVPQPS